METSDFGKSELIPALVWIVFSILIIVGAYTLDIGTLQSPGSGMFPFLLGILLLFASLPVLIFSLMDIMRRKEKGTSIWTGINFRKIGGIICALLAYGFILERVGFEVTTFLCLFFLFRMGAGSDKLGKPLVSTIITVICTYLLFVVVLKVYMPSFPWRDFVNMFF